MRSSGPQKCCAFLRPLSFDVRHSLFHTPALKEFHLNWRDYQEEAAEFFRSLGLEAETDVTIQGARTKHDIDVLVRSHHAGFDVTWLIECKHWKSKVF